MIGTVLNQRYHLQAELGRGGMGVVYRSRDLLLDRDVAIKVLLGAELGAAGSQRLLKEARAVARLNHPNIVSVYDAGEAEGRFYVVMEYVEGVSLHEQPPQTLAEAISITRQVCAALDHAHAHGIIHRDIKPENVLIAADGKAMLMDFGMARSLTSRLSAEGVIMGTAYYLAPEQALGQEVDGRADLYALGVMLYEMATNRLPFSGDDPLAVISQHLYAPVVPPCVQNPEIPPALNELILYLMARQRDERPATAGEVLRALDALEERGVISIIPAEERALDRIVRGRLVGREAELAEMTAVWRRVMLASGEERVLLVSGEPGVGKTRLVRELMAQVQVAGARVLFGECYEEGGAPYSPFAEIIHQAFIYLTKEDERTPGLTEIALADLITLDPDLRSRYPDVPLNPTLDSQSEQQRICDSAAALLMLLTDQAPVLLVLDDVHWADSGTLYLLRHLARRSRSAKLRLLILATYRDIELDKVRPWHEVLLDLTRERLEKRLKVRRLSREQTGHLLTTLFEEEIAPDFLDGIYQETEGNPFFVEEVCKTLIEDGKLYYKDGHWDRPPMTEFVIPQSVRIAIQTRVEKHPETTQETLRLAAALGREFEFQILQQATDLDEDDLITALENAQRAQFIEEVRAEHPGQVKYTFVHALIPATISESMSGPRRQRLHRRLAQAMESVHKADLDPVSGQIAALYRHAAMVEQAIPFYQRAAAAALRVGANEEANTYLNQALELVQALPENLARDALELDLLTVLGASLVASQGYGEPEVLQVYSRAQALCKQLGQPATPPILRALAISHIVHANNREGLDYGEKLVDIAESQDDPLLRVEGHYVIGVSQFWLGEFLQAREHLSTALGLYDPQQLQTHLSRYSQDPRIVCLCRLGFTLWFLGYPSQASKACQQSLEFAEELGHPLSKSYALNFYVMLHNHLRDFSVSQERAAELVTYCREYHVYFWLTFGIVMLGWAKAEFGDSEDGIALIQEGINAHHPAGTSGLIPFFMSLQAERYGRLGKIAMGLSTIEKAQEIMKNSDERWYEAEIYRRKAELLVLCSDTGGAEEEFNKALAVARRQEARMLELRAAVPLARLWTNQGRASEACQLLAPIYAWFQEGHDLPDLRDARELLASIDASEK